ncbi:hypothetical protein HYU19_04540 [Candidatus Woesearchaeota archaeon]|nr:hypothetical protein [Candidatus Woesearchaeota archaeon]
MRNTFNMLIIFAVLVALLAFVGCQAKSAGEAYNARANAVFCKDSDNGRNYGIKGTTTGSTAAGVDTKTDFCKPGSVQTLQEFYCDGSKLRSNPYVCKRGEACQNGACVGSSSKYTKADMAWKKK